MFQNLGSELALKVTELSTGKVATAYNSFLGLRHGPKAFLRGDDSYCLCLMSLNQSQRLYEHDLINELFSQKAIHNTKIIVFDFLGEKKLLSKAKIALDLSFLLPAPNQVKKIGTEMILGLGLIFFGQLTALVISQLCQVNIDNPSQHGFVNRVVQGVIIHE